MPTYPLTNSCQAVPKPQTKPAKAGTYSLLQEELSYPNIDKRWMKNADLDA